MSDVFKKWIDTSDRYWAYKPDPEDELSEGILLATSDSLIELAERTEAYPFVNVWDGHLAEWVGDIR
jgi:hypothetical protein